MDRKKWIKPIYEHIYLLTHFTCEHIYCSLLNIDLINTGLWYKKYEAYGKVCTEMLLVNVRSMHVLPRVVDMELMQSKLNLDFIKFTNDFFCVMSMLKSPHSRIGVSVSGFMFGKFSLQNNRRSFETRNTRLLLGARWDGCKWLLV
jgi:hypothetical protein